MRPIEQRIAHLKERLEISEQFQNRVIERQARIRNALQVLVNEEAARKIRLEQSK